MNRFVSRWQRDDHALPRSDGARGRPTGRGLSRWTSLCAAVLVLALAHSVPAEEDQKPTIPDEQQAKADSDRAATKPADREQPPPDPKSAEETPAAEAAKQEGAPDEGTKKPPRKPRNPLTDLIIKSMQPARPATPSIPVPTTPGKPATSKHPSDATAPYDRRAADWMNKARTLSGAGDWKQALKELQKITELPEDSLFLQEGGTWISLRTAADRLRGEAPPELLEEYRVQFGGLAQQLLAEAVRGGRVAALGRVARGYFHTSAGYDAANRLGTLHLERGEYASAARWFQALWNAKAPLTDATAWRRKAAFALKSADQAESARRLLADSRDNEAAASAGETENLAWLDRQVPPVSITGGSLSDWPMFYGDPSRTGRGTGGEPLLLPRWRLRLTDSEPVREQIVSLLEDMADQQSSAIPVIQPILLDGLAAFRTLHGVQVVEVETGRPLWTSMEVQAIDRLLSPQSGAGIADARFFNGMMMGGALVFNGNVGYAAGQGEGSPLCHLLFRNANFGLLSSDGVRLFVVEDPQFLTSQQPGNMWWNPNAETAPNIGTRLTAYDLRTGRPLWEVGGNANGEDLDPPLSGYFFFGPPVVEGSEMFLVGEATSGDRTGQIRLICLDPASGVELWSQLIAYSDSGIEKDIGRRWFTAQVAIQNGLVICPTTVGWLVAVDRSTHSVAWGFRPPRPNSGPRMTGPDGSEMGQMVQQYALSTVWHAAPPVVTEGRVVYTPTDPQVQTLFCLDQASGKELWNKPRGTGMYLAGVFDGLVLAVGRDATVAYRLTDGETAWTAKHTLPSGRGVAADGKFHLPLAAGEVWTIDLADGNVTGRTYLDEQQAGGVGNLLMYRGLILSVDPQALTAFEQKQAVVAEIVRRKAVDPRDPVALLREADIALLQRDYGTALGLLRQVPRELIPPTDREKHRRHVVETLISIVRSDFSRPETDSDLEELRRMVAGPEESLMLRRLEADRYVASGESLRAFEAYLQLAADSGARLVPQEATPGVLVRADLWVSGKISDLLAVVTPGDRMAIETRINELAERARGGDAAERLKFLALFPDQRAATEVRARLVDDFVADRNFARAEHQLIKLMRTGDGGVSAAAAARLAQLASECGLADLAEPRVPAAWKAGGIKLERMGSNYQNWLPQELTALGSRAPLFRRFRIDVDPQSQRMEMVDAATDRMHWSLPLRTAAGLGEGGTPYARASGHRLTLMHQGVLHTVSPLERRTLWSRTLDGRAATQQFYGRQQMPLQPMRPLSSANNRQPLQPMQVTGALALVSDEVVCTLGRRNLSVLDADTGEIRWQMQGVRQGTAVSGGIRVLYLSSYDPLQAQQQMMMMGMGMPGGVTVRPRGTDAGPLALRVTDGKRLEIPKLKETQSRALASLGDDFLLAATVEGAVELRRHDPQAGADIWKRTLRRGTLVSPLEGERLAMLEPATREVRETRYSVIDLRNGEQRLLANLPADEVKAKNELYAFSDSERVYLIVNRPGGGQNMYSEQIPYVRVNGMVFAFDAQSGELAWKHDLRGQNLMLERFNFSPLLVFVSRKYENKGAAHFWSMHMVALDKQTGARVLDEKSAQQPGFRSLTVNAAERYIELRGWNDRLRLYAADQTADASTGDDTGRPAPPAAPVEAPPAGATPTQSCPTEPTSK